MPLFQLFNGLSTLASTSQTSGPGRKSCHQITAFSDEKLERKARRRVSRCPSPMEQEFFNEGGGDSANTERRINMQALTKNFPEPWDRFLFCPC